MFESLNLRKGRFKIRTFLIIGILGLLALIIPFYFLLRPIYVHVDNPYFIIGYLFVVLIVFGLLEVYNKKYLGSIYKGFARSTFLHDLHPLEVMYLRTGKTEDVIHYYTSQLVERSVITAGNRILGLSGIGSATNAEEFVVMEALEYLGPVHYRTLLNRLIHKPVFSNIGNSMDAFKKYFLKSAVFGRLYYINFIVLSVLMLLGISRFFTGLMRGRPVDLIFVTLIVLIFLTFIYLRRLINYMTRVVVPDFYENEGLPSRQISSSPAWEYFLSGPVVLSTALIPLIYHPEIKPGLSSDGGGTSCGSSCSSSCGSSCGGCGGD